MIDSFSLWKNQGIDITRWNKYDERGICRICSGAAILRVSNISADLACGCWLKTWAQKWEENIGPYQHPRLPNRYLETMYGSDSSILNAITAANIFIEQRNKKWLIIRGDVGCGKTHIASAIADAFNPVSLFISVPSFDSMIFSGLENGELNDTVQTISRAPILILDDFGAGWGKEFVTAKLREIINFRYSNPTRYPLVITTNLSRKQERADGTIDPRILSRINDVQISINVSITASDYRISGGKSITEEPLKSTVPGKVFRKKIESK
jgi:chromosomal replication initiation ATPase DnaA